MSAARMWRLALAAGWAWTGQAAAADSTAVEQVRIAAGPEATRVVFDLSGPVEHRVFTLTGPDRVVIDVPNARGGARLRIDEPAGVVTGFRSGPRSSGELRLVIDLKQAARPKTFLVGPDGQSGHRLVVDLVPADRTVVQRAPGDAGGRDLVVAIDAGHGGKDPGAIGRKGTREKDVVLAIARRLKAEIDAQPGMRAVLVRNGDVYYELHERKEIAQRAGANLFLSIHADAVEGNSSVRGATVYALSEGAAKAEANDILANRDNRVMGGVSLADYDPLVAGVLVDLSQDAALSASHSLGQRLIRHLSSVTTMRKSQVQHKYLGVLKAADIPSLLIETAYISNPRDEAALGSGDFQAKLARAMREAVVEYCRAYPPPGSYCATPEAQRAPRKHVIARGETLSGIADRYRVSVATLLRLNELRNSNVIRVGQVLTIPPG